MKVVILAGGLGTRISEESHLYPKPMIEIGGRPILWHIMKTFTGYGFNDFVVCAGYKQEVIKDYFANYYLHRSDVTFDFTQGNAVAIHDNSAEPWKVTVVDTGLATLTGGRVRRIREFTGNERFFLTYGDGVSDVNIGALLAFHEAAGKTVTLTAIQPMNRFGVLEFGDNGDVISFAEKRKENGDWINGGYMVCEPELFSYVDGDNTSLESATLERLAQESKLSAYKHHGFWQCMDTKRDREQLEALIRGNEAPWMNW